MNNILPNTNRPCPLWCTLPAGHGWESLFDSPGGDLAQRYHVRPVAKVQVGRETIDVDIMASETAPTGNGLDLTDPDRYVQAGIEDDPTVESSLTPPTVAVQWPGQAAELTAASAETIARELLSAAVRAAAELDKITGQS
ncbi:DUF6907 domain-containing protein [Phycicoccus duodecadis]|uniref:Uncharacterized protein n=1 Tax=Phycicoccus duodecadis TaxID=173053 RepID=A0A2N3YEW9_9MICO|nr:hypothetical protein [Phycicoccus duodecadis]PKW25398.1 hypothetical protein ATL31_0186 [Phycicoccus duodecadis]